MKTPPNSKPFRLEIERLRAENERLRKTAEKLARAEAALRGLLAASGALNGNPDSDSEAERIARACLAEVGR